MKSNKSKKPAKISLNLKQNLGVISIKEPVLSHKKSQNLIFILSGLFIFSLSFLGAAAYTLHQKQYYSNQKNTTEFASQNKPEESEILGVVEGRILNQAESLVEASTEISKEFANGSQSEQKPDLIEKLPIKQAQELETISKPVEQKVQTPVKNAGDLVSKSIEKKVEIPTLPINIQTNFKTLTPKDFHNILVNHTFENTTFGGELLSATGLPAADQRINQIAQSRGFQLWPQAIESQLIELKPNIRLLPKAKQAYLNMVEAAKKDQVIISVISGYRSQSDQNTIFKPRFEAFEMAELGGNYTPEELATGQADDLIFRAMALTAPPGYSRHHTGYAVDLADLSPDNTSRVFNGSKAFKWLSSNNFANARRFGFIPSYPEGLENVGPQPEAWEYVWVGDSAR